MHVQRTFCLPFFRRFSSIMQSRCMHEIKTHVAALTFKLKASLLLCSRSHTCTCMSHTFPCHTCTMYLQISSPLVLAGDPSLLLPSSSLIRASTSALLPTAATLPTKTFPPSVSPYHQQLGLLALLLSSPEQCCKSPLMAKISGSSTLWYNKKQIKLQKGHKGCFSYKIMYQQYYYSYFSSLVAPSFAFAGPSAQGKLV